MYSSTKKIHFVLSCWNIWPSNWQWPSNFAICVHNLKIQIAMPEKCVWLLNQNKRINNYFPAFPVTMITKSICLTPDLYFRSARAWLVGYSWLSLCFPPGSNRCQSPRIPQGWFPGLHPDTPEYWAWSPGAGCCLCTMWRWGRAVRHLHIQTWLPLGGKLWGPEVHGWSF